MNEVEKTAEVLKDTEAKLKEALKERDEVMELLGDLLSLLDEPEFDKAGDEYFNRTSCDCGMVIDPARAFLKGVPK